MSGEPEDLAPDEPVRDDARSVQLDDTWEAVTVVYGDRGDWLWVMDMTLEDGGPNGCACPACAPHDWLDPHRDEECALTRKVSDD